MKLIFLIQYIQSSIKSTYKQYLKYIKELCYTFFLTRTGKSAVSLALKACLSLHWPHVKCIPATYGSHHCALSGPAGSNAEESVPKGFPLSGQAQRDLECSIELGKESTKWVSLPSK